MQETIEMEAVSSILLEPQATRKQRPLQEARARELDHNENTDVDADADARWRLAKRVVNSRHFARSPLLSKFLLFVVTETLAGRQQEITEHQIGVQVFGRPTSYRTVEDNIVRNYARQLRKRLAEHFAEAGSREAMQIEIPVGGYVPVFSGRASTGQMGGEQDAPADSLPAPEDGMTDAMAPAELIPPAAMASRREVAAWWKRRRVRLGVAMLLGYSALLISLTWGVLTWLHSGKTPEPARALWQTLLKGPESTYIVPPDAGFNLMEDISHRSVPLADYMHSSYRELPLPQLDDHSVSDLRSQQLTDFVDVQIVAAISRLPDYDPHRVSLRFPRDLRLDDLKNANAILIGSVCSNPWAALRDARAEFAIVCSDGMQGSAILNRNPRRGEDPSYASRWNEPTHVTYALISFQPNLSGRGHLLLLEGLDVAGTQAAAEAVLESDAITPILKRATRPDGSVAPFEVLLRATSIQANATDTQVIASRIH
jgi:hypothetical protein